MGFTMGFTMIEVVIASAVAVILLAAVHSTVTAMSRSAKNIRKNSEQHAGMQRFLEILRRDLQGWCVTENEATPNAAGTPAGETPLKALLNFTTTADGLTQDIQSDRHRASSVAYSVRASPEGTEVLRTEGNQAQAGEVVVWKDRRALTIEFLKDKKWVAEWTGKERPACLRVRSGADEIYLSMRE
jgi:type II secretory pathway pseudopilin PulG